MLHHSLSEKVNFSDFFCIIFAVSGDDFSTFELFLSFLPQKRGGFPSEFHDFLPNGRRYPFQPLDEAFEASADRCCTADIVACTTKGILCCDLFFSLAVIALHHFKGLFDNIRDTLHDGMKKAPPRSSPQGLQRKMSLGHRPNSLHTILHCQAGNSSPFCSFLLLFTSFDSLLVLSAYRIPWTTENDTNKPVAMLPL